MKVLFKTLFLSLIMFASSKTFAQTQKFSQDSIPLIGDEVIFSADIESELSKKQLFRLTYYYINNKLEAYSGELKPVGEDSIICRVTDYLDISTSLLSTFAMYITYDLKFKFDGGLCSMTIDNIEYAEKGSFEAQEKSNRDLDIMKYSGKDIMIDKQFKSIFTRSGSERITEATINRFNSIVTDLNFLFEESED